MNLAGTQQRVASAIMSPLTGRDHMARRPSIADAARLIKPSSGLTSRERLEIYCRSYWSRVIDSLRDDFPGLAAILGQSRFERLARAYLADCPSRSFTLRDLGSRLEAWLEAHPSFAGANPALALDMVSLEWAHIVAFDGPDNTVLTQGEVADMAPNLRVGLQPYVTLLQVNYPVDAMRAGANADGQRSAAASNTAVRTARRELPGLPRPDAEPLFLAVHRVDLSVYYRRLTAEEFRLLQSLRAGRTIASAITTAFRMSPVASDHIPGLLTAWFGAWAEFGWLTSRSQAGRGARK
jgi:hypothetical protein